MSSLEQSGTVYCLAQHTLCGSDGDDKDGCPLQCDNDSI